MKTNIEKNIDQKKKLEIIIEEKIWHESSNESDEEKQSMYKRDKKGQLIKTKV